MVAHLLIDLGARPDPSDDHGSMPLHISARFGKVDVANVPIAGGAHFKSLSSMGLSPAEVAHQSGQLSLFKLYGSVLFIGA